MAAYYCPDCGSAITPAKGVSPLGGLCPRCLMDFALRPDLAAVTPAPESSPVSIEPVPSSDPLEGWTLAGYRLVERIGRGGMGAVYRAEQTSLHRIVAVKVLLPDLAGNEEYVKRFRREALSAASLEHTNIIRIYDVGEAPGPNGSIHFLATEFVRGETLDHRLARKGVLPERDALKIAVQIVRALDYAHSRGIVHRDVKPGNLMVDHYGVAKLMDLGLAKAVHEDGSKITLSGEALGTPWYMSPEQARIEKDIDIRSDIYSLGATLYHLVTGRFPFKGSDPTEVLRMHVSATLTPPDQINPKLSPPLCRLIEKMMAKNRFHRHQTPEELLADLKRVRSAKPPTHGDRPQSRT